MRNHILIDTDVIIWHMRSNQNARASSTNCNFMLFICGKRETGQNILFIYFSVMIS